MCTHPERSAPQDMDPGVSTTLVSPEQLRESGRATSMLRGAMAGSFLLHMTAAVGLVWLGQLVMAAQPLPTDRYRAAPHSVEAPPLVVKVIPPAPAQVADADVGEPTPKVTPPAPEPAKTARHKRARRLAKIRSAPGADQPAEAPATAALRPQTPDPAPDEALAGITTHPDADAPGPDTAEETTDVASHGDGTGEAIVAAPSGDGVDAQALLSRYRKVVSKAVHKRYRYPKLAKRAGLEGRVVLEVVVDDAGEIVDVRVARSSGHPILDKAAVASVSRLGQVPAPPSELDWHKRAVKVAFRYQLRG